MRVLLVREEIQDHPLLKSFKVGLSLDLEMTLLNLWKLRSKKLECLFTTDPIVYVLANALISPKINCFFSLEMFEHARLNYSYLNRLKNYIFKICHRRAISSADYVIFCNQIRREYYLDKGWVKCTSIVLENLPSQKVLNFISYTSPMDRATLSRKYNINLNGKICLVYAGSMSKERGVEMLIDRVSRSPEVYLFLVGNYIGEMKTELPSNVQALGRMSHNDTLRLIMSCDAQIAYYDNSLLNTRFAAPQKLYESAALGVPLIVNRNPGIESCSFTETIVWDYDFQKIKNINRQVIAPYEGLLRKFSETHLSG
jgi:glycosyltransferase involved in cell wall biosynthesis